MQELVGRRVAIVATDGFERSELYEPKKALEQEGVTVEIVAPKKKEIRAWEKNHWADLKVVNKTIDEAVPENYSALVLPGGVINADRLRENKKVIEFVRHFIRTGKPIAAICHGAWTLIETGYVKGRVMTSWPSLKTDLENAGAHWVDEEVVTDRGWVTSRMPEDLPAFNQKMIEEFSEGRHQQASKETFTETSIHH